MTGIAGSMFLTLVSPEDVKLYVQPMPATAADGSDQFSADCLVYYYSTQGDAKGSETPLTGTCYPVYWNSGYSQELNPAGQSDAFEFVDGLGTVSPNFRDWKHGGAQRVTIDFNIDGAGQRVYFPAGFAGTKFCTQHSLRDRYRFRHRNHKCSPPAGS